MVRSQLAGPVNEYSSYAVHAEDECEYRGAQRGSLHILFMVWEFLNNVENEESDFSDEPDRQYSVDLLGSVVEREYFLETNAKRCNLGQGDDGQRGRQKIHEYDQGHWTHSRIFLSHLFSNNHGGSHQKRGEYEVNDEPNVDFFHIRSTLFIAGYLFCSENELFSIPV